jgi:GntR family transcriptional regulator
VPTSKIAKRLAESLNHDGAIPVTGQIVDAIWEDVIEGGLDTGERMPTVRQLSIDLGVSPRTISRAYERLEQLGVLTGRAGEGTFVSLSPADPAQRDRWKMLEARCKDLIGEATSLGFSTDDIVDTITDLPPTDSSEPR